jgi:hypothetical protein
MGEVMRREEHAATTSFLTHMISLEAALDNDKLSIGINTIYGSPMRRLDGI